MGNVVGSFFSGFTQAIGKLFGSPLDFLSGKSCSSICTSTWDFICYIENFCVANLLKMAMVLVLSYIVLLFLYLLYKLGFCQCIGRSLCKMVWACITSWFAAWEYCCTFCLVKLLKLKRRRHERRRLYSFTGEEDDGSFSYHLPMEASRSTSRCRDYKGVHLRKSLRPRSRRIQIGFSRGSVYRSKRNPIKHSSHGSTVHHLRVTETSRFVHKGRSYRRRSHHSRRQ